MDSILLLPGVEITMHIISEDESSILRETSVTSPCCHSIQRTTAELNNDRPYLSLIFHGLLYWWSGCPNYVTYSFK